MGRLLATALATALVIALAIALPLMTAWGADSDKEFVASAKSALAQKDRPAALIDLKNTIASNGDSGKARYLLGKTLLESGDPVTARVSWPKPTSWAWSPRRWYRRWFAQGLPRAKQVSSSSKAAGYNSRTAPPTATWTLRWRRPTQPSPTRVRRARPSASPRVPSPAVQLAWSLKPSLTPRKAISTARWPRWQRCWPRSRRIKAQVCFMVNCSSSARTPPNHRMPLMKKFLALHEHLFE